MDYSQFRRFTPLYPNFKRAKNFFAVYVPYLLAQSRSQSPRYLYPAPVPLDKGDADYGNEIVARFDLFALLVSHNEKSWTRDHVFVLFCFVFLKFI